MMDGHRPKVWLSDRYSAQQGHAGAQQTCLAHLARDVAYAREASDDPLPLRLELWLRSAFDLAGAITTFAASTRAAKRRSLERRLAEILAAPTRCDLARDLQRKVRRARDQLLTFVAFPGAVEVTNNACERALRPAVCSARSPTAIAPCGPPTVRPRSPPSFTLRRSARERQPYTNLKTVGALPTLPQRSRG